MARFSAMGCKKRGLAAALGCWGLYLATDNGALAAIARFGAWINLFNLLPMPPFDGRVEAKRS